MAGAGRGGAASAGGRGCRAGEDEAAGATACGCRFAQRRPESVLAAVRRGRRQGAPPGPRSTCAKKGGAVGRSTAAGRSGGEGRGAAVRREEWRRAGS